MIISLVNSSNTLNMFSIGIQNFHNNVGLVDIKSTMDTENVDYFFPLATAQEMEDPTLCTPSGCASTPKTQSFFIPVVFILSIQIDNLVYSKGPMEVGGGPPQKSTSNEKSYADIGFELALLVIFGFMFIIVKGSKSITKFAKDYGLTRDPAKMGPPKSVRYFQTHNSQDLLPVIQNMSNNLRTLITIYGILLSFIIASQLQIATSSITFIIWTGLILSIIIRGWYYEHTLSDIWIVDNIENTKSLMVTAKLFSRRATYLLVVVVSITPAFFIISNNTSNESIYPWSNQITLLSISISIIIVTVVAYQFIFSFGKRTSGGLDLVTYSMILLFLCIITLNVSPLKEFPITFFNIYEGSIPIILFIDIFPILLMIMPYGLIYFVYPPIGYLYIKLKNRIVQNKEKT